MALFFSETIVVCGLKLGRLSIEGQGHFLTLAQGHLHMKIKTDFSQKPVGHSKPNFVCAL